MTEPEALQLMVPPGKTRPGIWRGGIIQIWITRACNLCCYGCTQGSNLAGKPRFITPEQFERACVSLKEYFGIVGVFGGSPCLHPEFESLCEVLRRHIPWHRRGLWANRLFGKGATCRATFNPGVSNLNVHLDRAAYVEIRREWPEARPKGMAEESRHSPPYVAMQDLIVDEGERWQLISTCDINQRWSAMVCVFRDELRAFCCEIAGAQAMLHQDEPDYPDLGLPVEPGWWRRPIGDFAAQIRHHCHACGIPLRGRGELAQAANGTEEVTRTHASVYVPKKPRAVRVVETLEQLQRRSDKATDYIQRPRCAAGRCRGASR